MPSNPLLAYHDNVHSQNGEDGVIAELFKRLSQSSVELSNWCVEYGAWDGMHLSNTFLLVEKGWNAVYIEGDTIKYADLLKTAEKFPSIVPIEAFVARGVGDPSCLDSLLSKTPIPKDFDLLSIDIDSYDLETWEGLTGYQPKIVIIEINCSFSPGVYHRCDGRVTGNSLTSTLDVAHRKGYELVCHIGGNLIFVKSEFVHFIGLDDSFIVNPSLLFNSRELPTPASRTKSLFLRSKWRLWSYIQRITSRLPL